MPARTLDLVREPAPMPARTLDFVRKPAPMPGCRLDLVKEPTMPTHRLDLVRGTYIDAYT
jgi:hypothetical protein